MPNALTANQANQTHSTPLAPEASDAIPKSFKNPLIDEYGDTTLVRATLAFLANAFCQTPDSVALDTTECFGLGLILRTCSDALDAMGEHSSRTGGEA